MRRLIAILALVISTTATAQNSFIDVTAGNHMTPRYPGQGGFTGAGLQIRYIGTRWYGLGYRPAGVPITSPSNLWSYALVAPSFNPSFVRADDGNWYWLAAPVPGQPGYWFVR